MRNPLAAITLSACLLAAGSAQAFIAGPYTADLYTLHLWHLDESVPPCVDSASSGGINLINLATGATLGNAAYTPSFGTALNTGAGGVGKGDTLSPSVSPTNAISIELADPTTGAFTFEAVVQVGFDPAFTSTTTTYQIMSGESGVNGNRIFQWRIVPKGFTLVAGQTATNGPYMTFENIRAVSANQATIYAALPLTGPDAVVSNGWYHVAVTYNGVPSTPNNLIFYWTAMNATNTADDPLTIVSAVTQLTGLNPRSTVSTPFLLGNQARNLNGNFPGSIDEVRISRVARGPSGMMFSLPSVSLTPLVSQFIPAATTLTLTSVATGGLPINYQWQLNSTNITGATATNISGFNSNSLVISNITLKQSGVYSLTASNGSSSASISATIAVGSVVPGMFNTGVDANGNLLAGGSVDPHWQLVQSADGTYTGPNAFVDSTVPATYLAEGPNSVWIAPGDNVNVAGGNYEYQTTFVLDSENTNGTQLTLNWAADNVCTNVILNGVTIPNNNGNAFASFASTIITNNFVPGLNTLICIISNLPGSGPNLSAFRAELSALSTPLAPTPLQLLAGPTNLTVNQYQNAAFSVSVYGSGPLAYQWYFGTNALAGQTGRTLLLSDVGPAQAGSYSIVVSNSVSTNTSSATLGVIAPDTLEWQGLVTDDWDLATTNWYDLNSLSDVLFAQNDNVLFDDNGAAQPTVSLDVPLTPNSVIVNTTNVNYTLTGSGYLAGNFNLILNSQGTFIMDTPNTCSGNTIIQNGTLQIGNHDANGSLGSSAISNGGALVVTRTDAVTAPNTISGAGSLTMAGTGTLILTGNNPAFTGPSFVNGGGTLTPRSLSALGSGAQGVTVTDGSQLFIDQNFNFPTVPMTLGGFGNGNGALHKGGAGATILGGAIALTDSAGIGLDASSTLTLTNPAAITGANIPFGFQVQNAASCTVSGAINLGSGLLTVYGPATGAGTVILSGTNNVWTGGTTINLNSVLQIGDGGNDGSIGAGPISDGGALTYLSSGTIVETNAVSGSGVFNQSGTGRTILSGNPLSGFSGAIHINGNGDLQLANGDSLTSGTLMLGAAQADTNRLELTGNNTVSVPITIFPRAAAGTLTATTPTTNFADIVNMSGTNTVTPPSPVTINSGGNLFALESDSGYLIYNGGVTAGGSGRDFAVEGAGSGEIDGAITQNSGDSVNVFVLGTGIWRFNGQSLYTTPTSISNNATLVVNGGIASSPVTVYGGTLGGIGTLTGPVVVNAGTTLAPTLATGAGTPIGTLTINNTLTLQPGSFTSMQINKAAASSDQVAGLTSVSFGGRLSITNLGGTLAAGDSFQLFSATTYSGQFSSIVPATPGVGLRWDLSGLSVGGLLRVTSTSLASPTITSQSVSGGILTLSGTGGTAGDTYAVLTSTNVLAALTNWTQVTNGSFDGSGNFSITSPVSPTAPQTYFILKPQ